MLTDKMVEGLNEQINKEIYSAYLYLGMASYASTLGLNGFVNWFNVQVKEELNHAQKMYDYVVQQGYRVMLKAIDEPPQNFKSPINLFEETLAHERIVTGLINNLVKIAKEESDNATDIFLQWYVTEQVEEEANPTEIIQKLKLTGKDGNGLLMIDNELAQRIFTPIQPQE